MVLATKTHTHDSASIQAPRLMCPESLRADIATRGTMDQIAAAMAAHRGHAELQIYACWALLEMAAGDAGMLQG